jgi:formate-dependent nitrite reductase membrane component NrfD
MTDSSLTYYDQPLLPQPVWKWMIPAYYFVGGVTGAALVMSAAAQIRSPFPGRSQLMRSCRWIAFGGSGISAVLLVADLGRPERFMNMLRVFRPTSPMNMGAWILTGVGVTAPGALILQGRSGLLGWIGGVCGLLAGLFGAGLATYTGVLASNSAVPLWQESRRMMPILFGASAMASLGSVLQLTPAAEQGRSISTTFGRIGQIAELVSGALMERQASQVERVGRPFRQNASGAMWRTAAILTAVSVVIAVLPGRSRTKRIASSILGMLGSALMRFSIEQLGKASARDARASFQQQRLRIE